MNNFLSEGKKPESTPERVTYCGEFLGRRFCFTVDTQRVSKEGLFGLIKSGKELTSKPRAF